jgi:hypothetical protein
MINNTFGVLITLDYAHKSQADFLRVWEKIKAIFDYNDFILDNRMFQLSCQIKRILKEVQIENGEMYSYINDAILVNLRDTIDLILPDTHDNIFVEDISLNDANQIVTQ